MRMNTNYGCGISWYRVQIISKTRQCSQCGTKCYLRCKVDMEIPLQDFFLDLSVFRIIILHLPQFYN